MYTEYLREFLALARRLNYTQAAGDLHISQPTLSRHVAELEKHFGCDLVETIDQRLRLTYPGEVLLNEANALLRCEDRLERALADARNVVPAYLKIEDWRYSPATMRMLREAVNRVTAKASEYRVEFVPVEYGVEMVEAVRDGTLDVGILAHTAIGEPDFSEGSDIGVLPLLETRSRLCFFMDAENPLAQRESISLDDLHGHPITVPLNPECVNIRGDLTSLCRARGFEPVFYATRLASIEDMFCLDLKDGMLIGIEEYLSLGFSNNGRICMVPCADEVFVTTYLLFKADSENPILRDLLEDLTRRQVD